MMRCARQRHKDGCLNRAAQRQLDGFVGKCVLDAATAPHRAATHHSVLIVTQTCDPERGREGGGVHDALCVATTQRRLPQQGSPATQRRFCGGYGAGWSLDAVAVSPNPATPRDIFSVLYRPDLELVW